MIRPICFSCHKELHYISNRRMMCYNETCEKIYGMDYKCASCSAKKRSEVLMEVVKPGEVCCPLCGNKKEAPELNLETIMRNETISQMGQSREKQKRNASHSDHSDHFRATRMHAGSAPRRLRHCQCADLHLQPVEKRRARRDTRRRGGGSEASRPEGRRGRRRPLMKKSPYLLHPHFPRRGRI